MSIEMQTNWIPSDDDFGARLALVRHRMGWNVKEAAIACGLPAGSWRGWELYGQAPRNLAEVTEKISARTGVEEYWLLTGKKVPPQGDPGRALNPPTTDQKVGGSSPSGRTR